MNQNKPARKKRKSRLKVEEMNRNSVKTLEPQVQNWLDILKENEPSVHKDCVKFFLPKKPFFLARKSQNYDRKIIDAITGIGQVLHRNAA